jgi:hypothetical protein
MYIIITFILFFNTQLFAKKKPPYGDLFKYNYSWLGAPTGQTPAQLPQSIQVEASI